MNCARDTRGPLGDVALAPCVLCQDGANAIDHWLSYCPVVHITWAALCKGSPPPINWRQAPAKHIGVALTYLLFHLRRIVTEYGGLRPIIECVEVRAISGHAMDLWQRTYQSLPATLLASFRAPPTQADLQCTSTAHVRIQRFPQTQLESALLPDKGLCTTKTFKKNETIATFVSADARLRTLLMQYARLPFPAATASLLPYTCHCGATHLRLSATEDIPDNAIVLLGEASQWRGCLVQFDGSAHKRTKAGGAGVSLLQVSQESTTLVRWKSVPLLNCPDNVVAEAHACLQAAHLAIAFYHDCLEQGLVQDGGRGRIKRLEVVRILEECQQLLARAPFIFRLVYLPRECNKLADHFAGIASAVAQKASDDPIRVASHRALPPYHLAQKLGFLIDHGLLHENSAFVLTECPAAAPPQLAKLLQQNVHIRQGIQDYLATAGSNHRALTVGYKPSSLDGHGRLYAVGNAAQRLPRKARLILFGADHCELDISGAHYELARRFCAVAGVHLSLQPIRLMREWLRVILDTPEGTTDPTLADTLVKKWPLIVINSSTPQEAVSYIQRQLPHLRNHLPAESVRFAYELHTASRCVFDHPPDWCPTRIVERSRAAPFRFYEHLEQHTWAACTFLQTLVGFRSVIWLHDGFWVSPGPTEAQLTSLHHFLCDQYCLLNDDPPLRSERLEHKRLELLAELDSHITPSSGISGGLRALPSDESVRIGRPAIKTKSPSKTVWPSEHVLLQYQKATVTLNRDYLESPTWSAW